MSDEPQDGVPETTGTAGVPTPAISENSDNAAASNVQDADLLIEKLLNNPRFGEAIGRAVQSTKDKRFQDLEKAGDLTALAEDVQKLKGYLDASGGDVHKAAREMAIDQLLTSRAGAGSAQPNAEQTARARLEQETADILKEAGIAHNDPEVAQLAAKRYANSAEWHRELTRLAVRRAKQGNIGTPTEAIPDSGGKPPHSGDKAEKSNRLYAELEPLLRSPTLNRERIAAIRQELARLT